MQPCLAHELILRGLPFEKEKSLPVCYKGVLLDCGYRLDFLIASKVIVEVKAVEVLAPIHEAQLMTCLRLAGCPPWLILQYSICDPVHQNDVLNGDLPASASLRCLVRYKDE